MDNNNLPKKAMIILYCTILGPIFIGICVFLYKICFNTTTPKEYYLQDQKNIEVHSDILLVYNDEENHNVQTLKLRDTLFTIPPDWEDKFESGDSISKNKGSLKIFHYNTNDSLKEILDYNKVVKK